MYIYFQNQTLTFIPSFREVTYSLVLGQKDLKILCSLCKASIKFMENNFVNTPSPSLASQTFVEMMAMVMMFVLNTNNLKEKKHIDGNVDYLSQRT